MDRRQEREGRPHPPEKAIFADVDVSDGAHEWVTCDRLSAFDAIELIVAGECPLWAVISTGERNTYLDRRTWSGGNEEVSSGRVYCGPERRVMGALEEGRRAEVDWPRPGQAVVLHFLASEAQRRDHAAGSTTIPSGANLGGTRGDIERPGCGPIASFHRCRAWSLGLDGQPRDLPQWRITALPR